VTALASSQRAGALWCVAIVLGFLTAGWQDMPSAKSLALLPWLIVIAFGREALRALVDIAREYRLAVVATAVLALLILFNEAWHGFTKTGLRHFVACLAWPSVAALALMTFRASNESKRRCALAVALAVVASALTMIVQRAWLGHERPIGLSHNVHAGTLALLGLCVVIACVFAHARAKQTTLRAAEVDFILAVAIVGAAFVVVLSGARSPLLAFGITAFALVAILGHHLRFTALTLLALTVLMIVVLGHQRFVDLAREFATYVAGDHATSVGGRLDAWRWFTESGLLSPLFGQSADAVRSSLAARAVRWGFADRPMIDMWHLHNDALQLVAAYGVLAATSFFAILAGFVARAARAVIAQRDQAPLAALVTPCALVAATLIVAIAGITDTMTYWLSTWVAWSSAIAILLALQRHERETPTR
jgi:O-antigen ligase